MTVLRVVLLIVSGLSFTRGMRRLYEGVYGLDNLGVRNTPRALTWLVVVTVFVAVRPLVLQPLDGWPNVAATLALSVLLWLVTPYLMLGRRVSWQRRSRERSCRRPAWPAWACGPCSGCRTCSPPRPASSG